MTTLQTVIDEGRLIRNQWSRKDADGRELLCLYTAFVGDSGARPETCPASLAPKWLAHLLPWMDNDGSAAAWPAMVARVAKLTPRFGSLPPKVEWRVRALCVREAMRYTTDASVLAVCERAAVLCERKGRGETVPDVDFQAVREEAETAARATATTAWETTWAAAAAWAATEARAAARAAATAARAAVRAAWAAAAVDRLTTAILDEIEKG